MTPLLSTLRERFSLLEEHPQRPDLTRIAVPPEQVVTLLGWLKQHSSYRGLTLLSAVDWLEDGEFQLTYLVTSPQERATLAVTTRIARPSDVAARASADSVAALWPQALTYEQELAEMYGIDFPGSPRVGTDFILEDWPHAPPMRRDFDTAAFVAEHFPPPREDNAPDYLAQRAATQQEPTDV